ncbi:MAG: FTR1 family protein [Hyphomicrobium sp.]
MLATAIIVFREAFEAALVIGIVMAACRMVQGRSLWIGAGIAAGIVGSCLVALAARAITEAAEGMGQELLNASILLLAAAMLAWHAIWMSKHGKDLARHVKEVSASVAEGRKSLLAIAIVVGLAVLREGSETVLFLAGLVQSGETSLGGLLGGVALGLLGGAGAGMLLYKGLLHIPPRHFFTVTNWMILLLMAGMAAAAVGFLVQAGVVPPLADPLWDTSWLLDDKSIAGKLLHTLIGYQARPAGIQVLVYVTLLAVVGRLAHHTNRVDPQRQVPARSAA